MSIVKVIVTYPTKENTETSEQFRKRIAEFEGKIQEKYQKQLPYGYTVLVEHCEGVRHARLEMMDGGNIESLVKELKTFRSKIQF